MTDLMSPPAPRDASDAGVGPAESGRGAAVGAFLRGLGVVECGPRSFPFDPGYDAGTLAGHVNQSHELMAGLKLSMGTWLLVAEESLRDKVRIVRDHGLPMTVGGSLFEISADRDRLPEYFDLCHRLGITGVEAGHGFTQVTLDPRAVVRMAADRGLTISFEVGAKHDGPFHPAVVDELLELGGSWLEAGATHLVVEARESAVGVGLFDSDGRLNCGLADAFAAAFGLERVVFEAPNKGSQFAFIDHFGPKVALGNIRLEELLRVETYRRGLHSDAYGRGLLGAGDGGARAC